MEEDRMRQLIYIMFIGLMCIQNCSHNSSELKGMDEQLETKIIEKIEARVSDYIDAYKRLDIEHMFDFYADSDGFAYASDGSLITDFKAWTARSRENTAKIAKVNRMEIENPKIAVLDKNAVSYAMAYSYSMTMKSGDISNVSGSWLYVFKKINDTWRVVQTAGTHINIDHIE